MISILRRFIATKGKLVVCVSVFSHRFSKVTQLVLIKLSIFTPAPQLTPSYDTHERYSPQPSHGYSPRSSPPVMPSPSDSRRLPPLTTWSPGGYRWQQSDYGMPTAHGYPNNILSPTASYPTTYVTYPSSNQTSFYSYHLPTNRPTTINVPDDRSLSDSLDSRDPRCSSPYSRGSGPSQVSPPSYTPPPASPTSFEESTINKKRKRADPWSVILAGIIFIS